jgi:hypothetical protein
MNVVVKETPPPWAPAQDHDKIIVEGYKLLIAAGITEPMQLLKALAHMIWASGWRQDTANYNTHKIRVGSWWDGPVYLDPTYEEDRAGQVYFDPKAHWRSYNSFTEGIHNYLALLDRPHMKKARAAFYNPAVSVGGFADALEESNYWTAGSADEGAIFESMARRIINTLERYDIPLGVKKNVSHRQVTPIIEPTQIPRPSPQAMGVGIGGGLIIGGIIWWWLNKDRKR